MLTVQTSIAIAHLLRNSLDKLWVQNCFFHASEDEKVLTKLEWSLMRCMSLGCQMYAGWQCVTIFTETMHAADAQKLYLRALFFAILTVRRECFRKRLLLIK